MGCGQKTSQTCPEAKKPEYSKKKPDVLKAFSNTLGMKFVPVQGTKVQFCIWETRLKDYAAYAAANPGVDEEWKHFGYAFSQHENTHPVIKVNWNDAQMFCAWLTKKELAAGQLKSHQYYRLPTDIEWSIAVGYDKAVNALRKKKDGRNYPWGKVWPPPKGAGNYAWRFNADDFEYTSPVGSFAANKNGLYDMGGNVWEWCEDKWNPLATNATRVLGLEQRNQYSRARMLRGASWFDDGTLNSRRSPPLIYSSPVIRDSFIGFRCVLASE